MGDRRRNNDKLSFCRLQYRIFFAFVRKRYPGEQIEEEEEQLGTLPVLAFQAGRCCVNRLTSHRQGNSKQDAEGREGRDGSRGNEP